LSVEIVKGVAVTIRFDASRCVHSRNCVLNRPDVFVPNVEGEWIHPDAASPEDVVRIGQNCPSGAIEVFHNEGGVGSNAPPLVNTMRVRENGPLAVEAELSVGGAKQDAPRATLCRCGRSKNKPFCDGAHAAAGFTATGEPAARDNQPLAARDGPLNVQPVPDGPLKLSGNLELVSGTGRTVNRVTEVFLCRCGESKNKPYCDGSHKAAGFRAP
jgi:CDGSH-type Zn-finger protein/uncharacterized Fe-S cluster protein YjdI